MSFTITDQRKMIASIIGEDKIIKPSGDRHSCRVLVIGGTGAGKSSCIKSLAWLTKHRLNMDVVVISPGASSGSWISEDSNYKNNLFNGWNALSVKQKSKGKFTLTTRDKMRDSSNGAEFVGNVLFKQSNPDPKILILDDVIGNIGGRKTTDDRVLNAVFTMTRQPGWRVFATIHPGASVQQNIKENFTHLVVPKYNDPENLMTFSKIVANITYANPMTLYEELKQINSIYHQKINGEYLDKNAVIIYKRDGNMISHGALLDVNNNKTNTILIKDIIEGNKKELIKPTCLINGLNESVNNRNSITNNVGVNNGNINNNINNVNINQKIIFNNNFERKVEQLIDSYDNEQYDDILSQCKTYSKMLLRYIPDKKMEEKFINYKKWYCKKHNLYKVRTTTKLKDGKMQTTKRKVVPLLGSMFKIHSSNQNFYIRKYSECKRNGDIESSIIYLRYIIFSVCFHIFYFFSGIDFKSAERRANQFADDYIYYIEGEQNRIGGDNLRKIGSSVINRLPGGTVGNVLFNSLMDYGDSNGLTKNINRRLDRGIRNMGDALNYIAR